VSGHSLVTGQVLINWVPVQSRYSCARPPFQYIIRITNPELGVFDIATRIASVALSKSQAEKKKSCLLVVSDTRVQQYIPTCISQLTIYYRKTSATLPLATHNGNKYTSIPSTCLRAIFILSSWPSPQPLHSPKVHPDRRMDYAVFPATDPVSPVASRPPPLPRWTSSKLMVLYLLILKTQNTYP
jgi:hypothetical protein